MQRIWKYIYFSWAILCVVSGYRSLTPERTTHFYMPWSFIVVSFFFFCVAPLGIIALRNCFGFETVYRRPSLDRTPFNRQDILQAYRLFWVSSALMSLGACFALPRADDHGTMMFWSSVGMSAGIFIGERIVYLVHAKEIPAHCSNTKSMRNPRNRLLILLLLLIPLIVLLVSLLNRQVSNSRSVSLSFIGFTNLPGNTTRFALFSISNQAPATIRLRDNWVEIEGSPDHHAEIINPKLPCRITPTLESGNSLTIAVGDPDEGNRWRLVMMRSRHYGWKERWLDLALDRNWPIGIGRFSLIDSQQILDQTNFVTDSSIWISK